MHLFIGSDHAGFELKEALKPHLESFLSDAGLLEDCGCYSLAAADYPDAAHRVASSVNDDNAKRGVLICGSGQGVTMVANKYANVRAALCWTAEIASLTRQHNDANVLCLPARFLTTEQAIDIVITFFSTAFSNEARHENRIQKIKIC